MPRSSKWFFPSGIPIKILYAFFIYPMYATGPVHLILDLITQIVFDEAYKL
jgi:hypothetical protein